MKECPACGKNLSKCGCGKSTLASAIMREKMGHQLLCVLQSARGRIRAKELIMLLDEINRQLKDEMLRR